MVNHGLYVYLDDVVLTGSLRLGRHVPHDQVLASYPVLCLDSRNRVEEWNVVIPFEGYGCTWAVY